MAVPWDSDPVRSGRRHFFGSLACLTASLGTGCAYQNVPFLRFAPPLFEATTPEGAVVHVFGALHVGMARFFPLPEPIETAYAQSTRLAVELDGRRHARQLREGFMARTMLPEGQTLDELVDPILLTEIRRHFAFDHQQWQGLQRLQPWALLWRMASRDDQALGANSEYGAEAFFLRRAVSENRPVEELETPDEQIHALSGGPMPEQLEQLARRFRQLQRFDRTLVDLVDAWRAGDLETLAQLKTRAFGGAGVLQALRNRVFADRDRRMAQRIRELATPGERLFVVIGALHLVGEDSLLAELTALGMTVRPVATDASPRSRSAASMVDPPASQGSAPRPNPADATIRLFAALR